MTGAEITSTAMSDADLALLRVALQVARDAAEHGNHPFGALLADAGGAVVLTAENTVTTAKDITGHAEINLVRLAGAEYGLERLRGFTLYSSCEPCAMCAGAIYWAGIRRVVYALGEVELLALTGAHPDNPTLNHDCRRVFADGQRQTTVLGPALLDEAAEPHRAFWR